MSNLNKHRTGSTAMPRRTAISLALSAGLVAAGLVAGPANAALVTYCIGTGKHMDQTRRFAADHRLRDEDAE